MQRTETTSLFKSRTAAAGYAAARAVSGPRKPQAPRSGWTPRLDEALAEANARLYSADTRPVEDAGEVAVIFGHSSAGTVKESVILPRSAEDAGPAELAAVVGARIKAFAEATSGEPARFPIVFLARAVGAVGGRASFERAVERAAGSRAGDGFALVFSPSL